MSNAVDQIGAALNRRLRDERVYRRAMSWKQGWRAFVSFTARDNARNAFFKLSEDLKAWRAGWDAAARCAIVDGQRPKAEAAEEEYGRRTAWAKAVRNPGVNPLGGVRHGLRSAGADSDDCGADSSAASRGGGWPDDVG